MQLKKISNKLENPCKKFDEFHEKLKDKLALYAGMDKVRFKHSVHPGDKVTVRSRMTNCRGSFISVEATATIPAGICASGVLSFMLVDKE